MNTSAPQRKQELMRRGGGEPGLPVQTAWEVPDDGGPGEWAPTVEEEALDREGEGIGASKERDCSAGGSKRP